MTDVQSGNINDGTEGMDVQMVDVVTGPQPKPHASAEQNECRDGFFIDLTESDPEIDLTADTEEGEIEEEEKAAAEQIKETEEQEIRAFMTARLFEHSEYERHLDGESDGAATNPWHPDLVRPLFPSQLIGFRWMLDRHGEGGGIVADKVGCGKVRTQSNADMNANLIIDLPVRQFHPRPEAPSTAANTSPVPRPPFMPLGPPKSKPRRRMALNIKQQLSSR
jgi:hypothetical protein